MNFAERLLSGATHPDAPALLTLEGDHSHGALSERVRAVAGHLARRGLSPGDRVVILSESSLFSVAAYLGAIYAGGVAVPLPTQSSREHLAEIFRAAAPRFAFLHPKVAAAGHALPEGCEVVLDGPAPAGSGAVAFSDLKPDAARRAEPVDERRDLAALFFTSGSTGRPRGVMLTHRNLSANTESILSYLPLDAQDRGMAVLPFCYSFGASLLHTHLAVGAALVLEPRFAFPEKVLERMQEARCTGFAGVPSHFQILLRRTRFKALSFPELRWLQQAGGKLTDAFIQELREAIPQAQLFVMYGATEATARISYLPPEMLDRKLGSIGRGIPGVTMRVLNERGAPVAAGEVGEIVVEGENVSPGYYGAPEESAAVFREGRLHTGDLATVDPEGFVYVVDRARDILKAGGTRSGSKELEDKLLTFPELVEVAVVGIPDEVLGEAVAAFVVPREGTPPGLAERLIAFARTRVPPPLVPRRVEVLSALPKSEAGKVLKGALRERLKLR